MEDITNIQLKDVYDQDDDILPYFQINSEFCDVATKLSENDALSIPLFTKKLQGKAKKIMKEDEIILINHMETFEVVFKPVLKNLGDLTKSLVSGEITSQHVIRSFAGMQSKELKNQLDKLNNLLGKEHREEDLTCCISKVVCLLQLKECRIITEKFVLVKDKLKLAGDFSTIEKIKAKVFAYVLFEIITMKDFTKFVLKSLKSFYLIKVSFNLPKIFSS